jgi:hypothetical protein
MKETLSFTQGYLSFVAVEPVNIGWQVIISLL